MVISRFNIDTLEMPANAVSRKFEVVGDVGAEFLIIALEAGTLKYYDFKNRSFEAGHNNLDNNLTVKLSNTKYNNSITFPAGGGDYVVKLITINGTTVSGSTSTVFSANISKQSSNSTITFKPDTLTATDNYVTFPTATSTGAANSSAKVDFNWDVTNVSTDAHGFGFRIPNLLVLNAINDKYWYVKATTDVDGAISSSTSLKVDSLTDIGIGTLIVSGTGLSGTPSVLSIDNETKTLTLSAAQSFSDGVTLTFIARGADDIKTATGLDLKLSRLTTATPTTLTKTARATSSSTTLNLNGTYGIAGGNHVTITGLGVDNSSANAVTSVNAVSSSAGSVLVQNAQTISAGTVITFINCFQVINFAGVIGINSFPNANKTVYLDLDKIITVGTVS